MSDRKKRCFIISPIGAQSSDARRHADAVLKFIIRKALKLFKRQTGITVDSIRSDEIADSGSISERMFEEILHADLCVAVLTGHNPNVFYELAVAQGAARPVILLIEKGEPVPFDVRDLRCVEYELADICQLVEGKYARPMCDHMLAVHHRGWSSRSLFELHGYGQQQRYEQQLRNMVRQARPKPLDAGIEGVYRLQDVTGRYLVLLTGDIVKMADIQKEIEGHGVAGLPKVDVIVSLEDVHLQLARYFEASIPGALSGALRYVDAKRSKSGKVERDSLYENLRKTLDEEKVGLPAPLGLVVATPTTGLKEVDVRYIFHVSAMTGTVSDGYRMMDDLIDSCVRGVYRRYRKEEGLRSLLFPLLGAAATRLEPEEIASRMLEPIVQRMKRTESCRATYVLAWLEPHRHALQQAAAKLVESGALIEEIPEERSAHAAA